MMDGMEAVMDNAAELEQQVALVLDLSERMTSLLDEELTVVAARNVKAHGELYQKKQRLLVDYQGAVKNLMTDKMRLAALNPTQRAKLKVTGQRLDRSVAKNAESLALAAAATQKVLQVIIETVRRESAPKHSYGNIQQGLGHDKPTPSAQPATFVREQV